jgi:hypothetical protein
MGNNTQSLAWLVHNKELDVVRHTPGSGTNDHTSTSVFTPADAMYALAPGNFDGQSGTDIAVTTWNGSSGSVYLISGKTFTPTAVATGVPQLLYSVQIGDLDGNGVGEIYAAGNGGGIYAYDAINGWRLLTTDAGIDWRDGAATRWPGESKDTVLFVGMKGGQGFRVISLHYDSISGTHLISGNAGVDGATLSYDDAGPQAITAESDGKYTISVPSGWSGTVTPSKTNFTFSPTNKVYPALTSDQTSQDYTATLTPPSPIAWVSPVHGSDACPTPPVGVDLLLTGITPSPWTLKLDGVDVTGASMMWELLMNPPRAITMYTPTTDLAPGVHAVEFDYATPAGAQVLTWNFTVTGLPCAPGSPSQAPPLDGSPPSSSTDSPNPDRQDIDSP